ncbi:bifunctional folylpolyglutamate synthase/dihydrofolate synthase [Fundidesulfovibrio agrisoli]|uniref:bifunctional folylpolyglutamate synthase/dihydrofolate synthase n=1 Tax=Fundidesulfovibrio agrisoli TaxID=2922717 RepID=UPI001FAE6F59|nr:cyanophycin synthetase [Fundidesulfovibrio agrisoli]
MDMGLSRMERALAALGLTRPACPGVQVVGTNGKGSTSTMLAAMLAAHGLRAGLYTSPHFVSPRERIRIDGSPAPDELWLEAAEAVLRVSADVSPELRLTYFELLTVMAAWIFRAAGCHAAVFEAGLGGWHDATSAIAHDLLLVTPIGLDHEHVIGPSLAHIARDKARAMRPGVPVIAGEQLPEVADILEAHAAATGAPLSWAAEAAFPPDWPDAPALPGPHQRGNLRLALAAVRALAGLGLLEPDAQALRRAAREAFIPGRLQMVTTDSGPDFLLDGAHNLPGLECLRAAIESLGVRPSAMIFACLADKDLEAMLPLAAALTPGPILVPALAAHGRAMPPEELAARMGPRAEAVADAGEALERVRGMGGTVLVCGSLYLLAEVYAVRPEWLEPAGR